MAHNSYHLVLVWFATSDPHMLEEVGDGVNVGLKPSTSSDLFGRREVRETFFVRVFDEG